MRRLVLGVLVGATLVGGCDKFAARSDIAAAVGDHQLTAERVASIMGKSGGGPTIQAAEFISNLWLDYSLFARAVAEKKVPTDSTAIDEVLWPTLATIKVTRWRDTVRAQRFQFTPASVDSAFNAPDNRVFQHIIVIPTGPTAADTAAARRTITDVLGRVRGGADFGELAKQYSADGSKNDGGYLPFGPKGQFVKEFDDAAWALEPGQLTGVVPTQFGFHIIRRPTLAEARARIEEGVKQRAMQVADSTYLFGLLAAADVKVASGAAAAMKTAIGYPEGSRKSSRTLVSMKGGNVTLADFVRWTAMFPLQGRMQIRNANDSLLGEFAKDLALRTLLLRAADSAGIKVEPQMRQFAHLRYSQSIAQLTNELGLGVPELSDSSKLTTEQKLKFASDKVEDFFGRLLEGRAQMLVMPPELGDHLRAQAGGKVNQAGVSRAVELATATFKRDSAAAAGQAPPGALQQAPGGPPIGEGKPDSTGTNP
ncbi:MAG: peptidyl-prolyl cis-trans isomerase [Gemmatimonadetes bacterium]|nr:peptidyl-prolyl cis-trans isomerase [Gemmatimonadota bacterium]MCC7131116.1 peptidyl-prolyl cis-trans isomerase [Gemmatimonadales bacterium]